MANNTINNRKESFWHLLSTQKIVIPVIQRDYAQGRDDKPNEVSYAYLRKNFLSQIFNALNSTSEKDYLTLDFVYGNEEGHSLNPLDGQQRLTTLWLIHWYIAFRLNKLITPEGKSTQYSQILQKFSYETRSSSREFCRSLCMLKYKKLNSSIVEYIMGQTWFYTAWKQDPTIQAMLRMICGTKRNDKEGNDILDGIEEFIGETDDEYLNLIWDRLTGLSEKCPITFFQMTIGTEKLPLSDDLYIKMNARGKSLNDFENFKASFSEWMKDEDNVYKSILQIKDEKEMPYWMKFSNKMDNEWMDIFWEASDHDSELAEKLFLKFINRICFYHWVNKFLTEASDDDLADNTKATRISERVRNYIFYKNSDTFIDFTPYSDLLNKEGGIDIVKNIEIILDNFVENDGLFKKIIKLSPKWWQDGLRNYDHVFSEDMTPEQQVFSFSIYAYFIYNQSIFQEDNIKDWLQFACNIIENPNIKTRLDVMVGRLRFINTVAPNSNFIKKHLDSQDYTAVKKNQTAAEQYKEEILKAKKSLGSQDFCKIGNKEYSWSEIIKESENTAFFNGAIRHLIYDSNGNENWSNFPTKYLNCINYFDTEGIKDEFKVKLTKALLNSLTSWDQLHDKQLFSAEKETWKNKILCNSLYQDAVHNILTYSLDSIIPTNIEGRHKTNIRNCITQTGLLPVLLEKHTSYRIKHYPGGVDYIGIYSPGGSKDKILLDWWAVDNEQADNERKRNIKLNQILSEMENNPIDGLEIHPRRIASTNLFYDDIIYIKYNGFVFRWQHWKYIDLFNEDIRLTHDGKYTIYENVISSLNSLVSEMNRCIKEYKEDTSITIE